MGFPTTPLMRQAMQAAQADAFRRGQLVAPSHLLLAIVQTPGCGAYRLIEQTVPVSRLQSELLILVQREPIHPEALPEKVPLSPLAKSAIEKSIADAQLTWF